MSLRAALDPLNQYVLHQQAEKSLLTRAREERAARERELAAERDDRQRGFLLDRAERGWVPQTQAGPIARAESMGGGMGGGATGGAAGGLASLLHREAQAAPRGLLAPRGSDGQDIALQYDPTQDQRRLGQLREAQQRGEEQAGERAFQLELAGKRHANTVREIQERQRREPGRTGGSAGGAGGAAGAGGAPPAGAQPPAPKPTVPRPPTEQQQRFGLIAPQLKAADSTITALESQAPGLPEYLAGKIPVVGNLFKSERRQQIDQASDLFAQHYLYGVSGASAPEAEVERVSGSVRSRAGDAEATRKLKQATRRLMVQGAERIAGVPGAPVPGGDAAGATTVPALNAADLWEQFVGQGMSPAQATAAVKARLGGR